MVMAATSTTTEPQTTPPSSQQRDEENNIKEKEIQLNERVPVLLQRLRR